ncbi:hypothetical protein MBLNU457_7213t1 [Dothideomycetes sp. NU457]
MPASEALMHAVPRSDTSRRSAQVTSMRQGHNQPQHNMERPSLRQKLRRLQSLQIPNGWLLPTTKQSAVQSTTSQAPSSVTTSGISCFESSSQVADCSGDLTDGVSFRSNTTWTSPAMTIADSISPASSFQLKQASDSTPDCQSDFSVSSPLTAQDIQQSVWLPYTTAFPCNSSDAYAANFTSSNSFGASYDTFPTTFQAMNVGPPYEQFDMSSAPWFGRSDVADLGAYSTFPPIPTIGWNLESQSANSDLLCNAMPQSEFVTPTQLVSHSSPVTIASSAHSSPLMRAESAVHASSIQQDDQPVFRDGSKTVHSISEDRRRKDATLVKLRRQGMSYKQIKEETGWTEAESTLRGQMRALSKPPKHRVRKPFWKRSDTLLLEDAIRNHQDTSSPVAKKRTRCGDRQVDVAFRVPWSKVAAYVSENGGSYPFSASACSKKWQEVADSLHPADRR